MTFVAGFNSFKFLSDDVRVVWVCYFVPLKQTFLKKLLVTFTYG